MTRIGRCQIKTRHLAGNASYRRDKLAPLKIPEQTASINTTVPRSLGYLAGVAKEDRHLCHNHNDARSTSFF
jgi:hypothetical protein